MHTRDSIEVHFLNRLLLLLHFHLHFLDNG